MQVWKVVILVPIGIIPFLEILAISKAIGEFYAWNILNVYLYVSVIYLILLCILFIIVDIIKSYRKIDRKARKYICIREAIFVSIIFIVGTLAFMGVCILFSYVLPFSFNEIFYITSWLPITTYSSLFLSLFFYY